MDIFRATPHGARRIGSGVADMARDIIMGIGPRVRHTGADARRGRP
ncbi:hypothetical protein [Roseovarius sp. A46]|nr:hypothetical protein [Roseovarius sp. A46]